MEAGIDDRLELQSFWEMRDLGSMVRNGGAGSILNHF